MGSGSKEVIRLLEQISVCNVAGRGGKDDNPSQSRSSAVPGIQSRTLFSAISIVLLSVCFKV